MNDELKREFKPEFLNRIDDIVIFKCLLKKDIESIVDIMLDDLQDRVKRKQIEFQVDDKVKKYLVDKGYDDKLGARPLRRAIQRYFEDELADHLLKSKLRTGFVVKATMKSGKVDFNITKIAKKIIKQIKGKKKTGRALIS